MEDERTELTVGQRNTAISSLKKSFQEGVEVIEILENATIVDKPVEYLTEADTDSSKKIFHYDPETKTVTYNYQLYAKDEEDPNKPSYPLLLKEITIDGNPAKRGIIKQIEEIHPVLAAKGLNWKFREVIKNKNAKWRKFAGFATIIMEGNRILEIHWFFHPDVGPHDVKLPEGSKRIFNTDIKEERVIMERREDRDLSSPPVVRRPTHKKTTKAEFFRKFKPSTDPKVITEDGQVVTSEAVLILVKRLKEFIEKGDVSGYCTLLNDDAKMESLSPHDCSSLWGAIISSGGWSVFSIYSSLLDRND
jgi:hypothetical protein